MNMNTLNNTMNNIEARKQFTIENLEDMIERFNLGIEILDNEYLDMYDFLHTLKYYNKREHKYYYLSFNCFTNEDKIELITDMLDEIKPYCVKSLLLPLFIFLMPYNNNKFMSKKLFDLYDLLTSLIIFKKCNRNITDDVKYIVDSYGNNFLKNFNVNEIDNDDYIRECINVLLKKLDDFKYLIDKEYRQKLSNDLISLRDRL